MWISVVLWFRDNIKVNEINDSIEIFNSNDALEQLLYNKKIQCSAWGKLYKRELLDGVKYPVGMLFEDIGTTYKLFYKAKSVVSGKKKLYFYFIRSDSISHMSFKSKNMDSLILSMEMCDFIDKNCNVNQNAIFYRRIIASLSIIKKIVRANANFDKELEYAEDILNEQVKKIKINSNMKFRDIILMKIARIDMNLLEKIIKKIRWL